MRSRVFSARSSARVRASVTAPMTVLRAKSPTPIATSRGVLAWLIAVGLLLAFVERDVLAVLAMMTPQFGVVGVVALTVECSRRNDS